MCHPECSWQCDNPTCAADCHVSCNDPVCSVVCDPAGSGGTCQAPDCRVVCPPDQCESEQCPACETVCQPPVCEDTDAACQIQCEVTQCAWVCDLPSDCPQPTCHLQCEEPACPCVASDENHQCAALDAPPAAAADTYVTPPLLLVFAAGLVAFAAVRWSRRAAALAP
jgi:hypothetical protein